MSIADDIKTVEHLEPCFCGRDALTPEERAALTHVLDAAREGALYVQQDRDIRAEHGWKRDGREMREIVGSLRAEVERLRVAAQRCMEISTALAAAQIVGHQNILNVLGAALSKEEKR